MTGEQFRTLRKLNSITQNALARQVGKGDRNTVYRVENAPYVPLVYLRALGTLLGINLTKPEEAKRLLHEMGISAPLHNPLEYDWSRHFPRPDVLRPQENLHEIYCRYTKQSVSRREFSNVLYHAVESGALRRIVSGNGVQYSGYKFPDPTPSETDDSKEYPPKTAQQPTKKAVFRTKKQAIQQE